MHGSIATASDWTGPRVRRLPGIAEGALEAIDRARRSRVALGIFLAAFFIYAVSNPLHVDFYDHYTWQADAWLHGSFAIQFPLSQGPHVNDYFQDVMPVGAVPGRALVPFPPMPAVFLLPLVAIFGLGAPASLFASILGAVNAVLAWYLAERLTGSRRSAVTVAVFYAFGTVAWYASAVGSTWFLAHVVAMFLTLLAVIVAVGADPGAVKEARRETGTRTDASRELPAPGADRAQPSAGAATPTSAGTRRRDDPGALRQFSAGLLLGFATLSRLTMAFGFPFLVLVGGGGARRRVLAAGAGLAIAIAVLVGYNLLASGQPFNPAYAYVAGQEFHPVPGLYHPDWSLEDPRYVPQNVVIALAWMPQVRPECGLALFDPACGTIRTDPIATSLLLTSPAYLLGLTVLPAIRRSRLVAGAALSAAAIFLADLAHFSQGWVQFGYRFSNDFAPFLLVLVALAVARQGLSRWVVGLVGISILVNAWGVYWGGVQGW